MCTWYFFVWVLYMTVIFQLSSAAVHAPNVWFVHYMGALLLTHVKASLIKVLFGWVNIDKIFSFAYLTM